MEEIFKNSDVPDSLIIKILSKQNKDLKNELSEYKTNLINCTAKLKSLENKINKRPKTIEEYEQFREYKELKKNYHKIKEQRDSLVAEKMSDLKPGRLVKIRSGKYYMISLGKNLIGKFDNIPGENYVEKDHKFSHDLDIVEIYDDNSLDIHRGCKDGSELHAIWTREETIITKKELSMLFDINENDLKIEGYEKQ